jgi:hypothetical protein
MFRSISIIFRELLKLTLIKHIKIFMEIFIFALSMFNNALMIIKLYRNMSQLLHVSIYFYHLQGITEININKTYIKIFMEIFIYALSMFNNALMIIKLVRNMSQLRQILCEKIYNYNISEFAGFILWIVCLCTDVNDLEGFFPKLVNACDNLRVSKFVC